MRIPVRSAAVALGLLVGFVGFGVSVRGHPMQVAPTAAQLPKGTTLRLMVTKEINSRNSRPGDRFKLRVDEAVALNGVTVIPVGATAWGEVISAEGTTMAGGKGRLNVRLLYLDLPTGRISITGIEGKEGNANTAGVVLGVLSFGLGGLFTKGGNASFKAGDILTGILTPGVENAPAPLVVPMPATPVGSNPR